MHGAVLGLLELGFIMLDVGLETKISTPTPVNPELHIIYIIYRELWVHMGGVWYLVSIRCVCTTHVKSICACILKEAAALSTLSACVHDRRISCVLF